MGEKVLLTTIKRVCKKHLNKSWQRVTSSKYVPENEIAQQNREGY